MNKNVIAPKNKNLFNFIPIKIIAYKSGIMTSIKLKFRKPTADKSLGTLYYSLIHNRVVRNITTSYHIAQDEWDGDNVVASIPVGRERNAYLKKTRARTIIEQCRLGRIVSRLKDSPLFSLDAVADEFRRIEREGTLHRFMNGVIAALMALGKSRTAETYISALCSFEKFTEDKDMMLEEITSDMMKRYQAFLLDNGASMNTVSFYMRILRAVYNRAVEKEIIEQKHPFRLVYTGVGKTVKRAVSLQSIRRIKQLNLSGQPTMEFARDMFLFSFYTRGMSFVDISFLKKSNLKHGMLVYRRRKTGQLLSIKWERCMQDIVDRYGKPCSEYMFPIITTKDMEQARSQYKNKLYIINRKLKRIAEMAGITVSLTTYVARHSWASIAHSKNIPVSVISEGMGHDSEKTTRIYLASLDTTTIDRANSLILRSL